MISNFTSSEMQREAGWEGLTQSLQPIWCADMTFEVIALKSQRIGLSICLHNARLNATATRTCTQSEPFLVPPGWGCKLSKTQQRWYFFKLSDPRETHWDLPPGAFGAAPRKQTTQEKTSTRAVEEVRRVRFASKLTSSSTTTCPRGSLFTYAAWQVLHVWYQRGALQGHNEAVGQVLQKVQQIGCDMSQEEHVAETEREVCFPGRCC